MLSLLEEEMVGRQPTFKITSVVAQILLEKFTRKGFIFRLLESSGYLS